MNLKKRQQPRTQKPTGADGMTNANDRLNELESSLDAALKNIHGLSSELERVKSKQQLQDQLNDCSAEVMNNQDSLIKQHDTMHHVTCATTNQLEDSMTEVIGDYNRMRTEISLLAAILKDRISNEPERVFTAVETQTKKSFWSKAATVAVYFGCGATGVYFSVATISAGHIAGWW